MLGLSHTLHGFSFDGVGTACVCFCLKTWKSNTGHPQGETQAPARHKESPYREGGGIEPRAVRIISFSCFFVVHVSMTTMYDTGRSFPPSHDRQVKKTIPTKLCRMLCISFEGSASPDLGDLTFFSLSKPNASCHSWLLFIRHLICLYTKGSW